MVSNFDDLDRVGRDFFHAQGNALKIDDISHAAKASQTIVDPTGKGFVVAVDQFIVQLETFEKFSMFMEPRTR